MSFSWIKKGLIDFAFVIAIGFVFVFLFSFIIKILVSAGVTPTYASTIISIVLIFVSSLGFSYLDYKNKILEERKIEVLTDIAKRERARKIKE